MNICSDVDPPHWCSRARYCVVEGPDHVTLEALGKIRLCSELAISVHTTDGHVWDTN